MTTEGTRDSWSLPLAFLFGAVGLPIVVLAGWLWLDVSNCTFIGCAETVGVVHVTATGLAFGYLAALAWGWPDGFVALAAGALVGLLLAVVAGLVLDRVDLMQLGAGAAVAAVIGVAAYPLGLLARWAVVRAPLLMAWGALLLGLAVGAIASPAPRFDPDLGTFLAPEMLFAAVGTLVVAVWTVVQGRSQGSRPDTPSRWASPLITVLLIAAPNAVMGLGFASIRDDYLPTCFNTSLGLIFWGPLCCLAASFVCGALMAVRASPAADYVVLVGSLALAAGLGYGLGSATTDPCTPGWTLEYVAMVAVANLVLSLIGVVPGYFLGCLIRWLLRGLGMIMPRGRH